jgi:hypothetical protein
MWSRRDVAEEDVQVTRVLFAEDCEIVGNDGSAVEDYAVELWASEMVGPGVGGGSAPTIDHQEG